MRHTFSTTASSVFHTNCLNVSLSNPPISDVQTRKNPNGRLHNNSFGKEKKLEETSGFFMIAIAERTTGAIQE